MHKIVYNHDHAMAQGVDIRLAQQVSHQYFENDKEARVMSNGQRVVAHVVLAADGVRSKARDLVLGYHDKPKPSGYAVYSAWMSSEDIAKNDLTKDLVIHGDSHVCWIGPDIHFIAAAAVKRGKEILTYGATTPKHMLTRHIRHLWLRFKAPGCRASHGQVHASQSASLHAAKLLSSHKLVQTLAYKHFLRLHRLQSTLSTTSTSLLTITTCMVPHHLTHLHSLQA